jgi:hypothetical protein
MTGVVATANLPCLWPCAMLKVPLAGPAVAGSDDVNEPVRPPVPAGKSRVTTPSTGPPPMGTVLEKEKVRAVGGLTRTLVGRVVPPRLAVIETAVGVDTSDVEIAYVAVTSPSTNDNVGGTWSRSLFDAIATDRPPTGAAQTSVTVPEAVDRGPNRPGLVMERGEFGARVNELATVDGPVSVNVAGVSVST